MSPASGVPTPARVMDLLDEFARLSVEVYRWERGLRHAEEQRDAVRDRILNVSEASEPEVTVLGLVETSPAFQLPTEPE